jgi:hypothetical protein
MMSRQLDIFPKPPRDYVVSVYDTRHDRASAARRT